ncbi:hypothetical protein [Companilactobacillus kedongensis]|uniref:hypothetical protein n=1 Tax=Companilactobacillus kedongensis TaxID=2486004 RepID=UPI000F79157D|nr:hypothetical protein [Companilactobacillus kedongensis]
MKKRGIFLLGIIALLLVITGCASQSKQSAPISKIETKQYDKLSKSDRDNIQFTFKRHEGTIEGQGQIDLTIKNQSNKNIKFDLEDFKYLGADRLKSDKSGIKTIKLNKKVTIKGIFKDIDETVFNDPGLFCYKSTDFKLAYLDGKTSRSSNLSDSQLKKEYSDFMSNKNDVTMNSESSTIDNNDSSGKSTDSSTTTDDDSSDSNNDDSDNNQSGSSNAVNSSDEAIALVQKSKDVGECFAFPNDDNDNTYLYDTSTGLQGYWIGIAYHGASGITTYPTQYTVLTDGTILDGRPDLN